MTQDEWDAAHRFLHKLWTDAALERFQVGGRWYDRRMKRSFQAIERAMREGMPRRQPWLRQYQP